MENKISVKRRKAQGVLGEILKNTIPFFDTYLYKLITYDNLIKYYLTPNFISLFENDKDLEIKSIEQLNEFIFDNQFTKESEGYSVYDITYKWCERAIPEKANKELQSGITNLCVVSKTMKDACLKIRKFENDTNNVFILKCERLGLVKYIE